jgi:hypothetical protein
MKLYSRVFVSTLIIAVLCGCAATPYDPFVVSRSEIYEKVGTVAMLPVQCPEFDRKAEACARYETLITERLEAAGFEVISSKESADITNAIVEQLGGIFDPVTGKVSESKQQAVSDHLVKEMNAKFEFDAFVAPSFDVVAAPWTGNYANWDGATDVTTGKTGFWAGFGNSNMSGTIPAMSLIVVLKDKTDTGNFYVGRGGVQLIARYGESFASGFREISKSEWFVDPARDVAAVDAALSKLVNEPVAAR